MGAEPRSVARVNAARATKANWACRPAFRALYLIAYCADRMMRSVMRMSVQASISAVMSANSLKYLTSVFMALPLPSSAAGSWLASGHPADRRRSGAGSGRFDHRGRS
jgi:hypothetical protein